MQLGKQLVVGFWAWGSEQTTGIKASLRGFTQGLHGLQDQEKKRVSKKELRNAWPSRQPERLPGLRGRPWVNAAGVVEQVSIQADALRAAPAATSSSGLKP